MTEDTQADEQFYDEEIAPALLELARKCSKRGVPFLAAVCCREEGFVGKTFSKFKMEEADADTALIYAAMMAKGNFDTLVSAVKRLPHYKGHNSVCLYMLENL